MKSAANDFFLIITSAILIMLFIGLNVDAIQNIDRVQEGAFSIFLISLIPLVVAARMIKSLRDEE